MSRTTAAALVAVDVGNSRIKLGCFEHLPPAGLPEPDRTVALPLGESPDAVLDSLARPPRDYAWAISSVNRGATARLVASLAARGVTGPRQLVHTDLPLAVDLDAPERVGTDRLASALAARELSGGGPAIVIGVGSAITVDLVTARGTFAGGAILPSLDMSARALHEFTDLLPLVPVVEPSGPLGLSTIEAMQFGIYWGAIGAITELMRRLDLGGKARAFVTGGGAEILVPHLPSAGGAAPQFVPHLTLGGIALAVRELTSRSS